MTSLKFNFLRVLIAAIWLALTGCGGSPSSNPESNSQKTTIVPESALQDPAQSVSPKSNGETTLFEISSSAFKNMEGIPEIYTCKGEDISPPLVWSTPPQGTQSLVLIMDDPDAPVGTWDHWILFNIPANIQSLEENALLPVGILPGQNSWRRNDYGGPCPPGGARHRYFFKLYALDTMLDLQEGAKKAAIEKTMEKHILASAELIGIYKP